MTTVGIVIAYPLVTSARVINLDPPSTAIPTSLFGMHIHRATKITPWPRAPFATWRLWDAGVAWSNLEPKKGEWHFEVLDKCVNLAKKHHVEVLLPLGLSPAWASARPAEPSAYAPGFASEPRNIEDWRNYVRTVATRYKGQIRYYEIWNEPNLRQFYSGSVEQMLTLSHEAYLILKQVDPSIAVVSPSATNSDSGPSWLEEYLGKGGGAYADVVGYHFYVAPKPPETMVQLIRKVQQITKKYGVSNKRLWNTEAGWPIANSQSPANSSQTSFFKNMKALTQDEAVDYVARSYIVAWAAGLERFYWYAWDNTVTGLTEVDGKTVKLPAKAYAEIQKWLVGTKMSSCEANSQNTWICQLTRKEGYKAWIVWNPEHQLTINIPKIWDVRQTRDLAGNKRRLPPKFNRIQIGSSPLLLERLTL